MRHFHRAAVGLASSILISTFSTSAFALLWPVGAGTANQAIYSTYGQYYEGSGGGLHFHEGVDIAVAAGTAVISREAGTVVSVNTDAGTPRDSFMIVRFGAGANSLGQNYFHMIPGNRPAGNNGVGDPGGPWAAGDTINNGNQLGTVAAFGHPAHPTHLHVDRGLGTDPYGGASNFRFPQENVLELYTPNTSTGDPTPTVPLGFHYLRADNDRLGVVTDPSGNGQLGDETERNDNQYFRTLSCGMTVVGRRPDTSADNGFVGAGSGNIDILADAWDSAGPATQYRNGIYKIQLKIRGNKWNDGSAPDGTGSPGVSVRDIWKFSGQFVDDGAAPVHEYSALRTSNLVRIPYANDTYSNSSDVSNGNAAHYWHIMTNNNDNTTVEAADRNRYWNSDVVAGKTWNNISAADATNNATSAFRDDIYSINVIASDVRGGIASTVEEIILDNWHQTLSLDGNTYQPTDTVNVIGGDEYDDFQSLPLYVMSALPADCASLSGLWGNTATDGNGSALGVPLGQYSPGNYWVVSDYNMDGIYIPQLDGLAEFTVVPEPGLACIAIIFASAAAMRRRSR